MSAPVITSVQVVYPNGQSSLDPGQTCEVRVTAVDADNYTLAGSVSVTDKAGNTAQAPFSIVVADSLTYAGSASTGSIVQDPTRPGVFFVTAP